MHNLRMFFPMVALLATNALATVVAVPPVTISALHHFYRWTPLVDRTVVYDAVTFPDGPGDFTGPGFTATLRSGDTIVARFEAPPGYRFVVTPHPEMAETRFYAKARWCAPDAGQASVFETRTVVYENLEGPTPVSTSHQEWVSDGGEMIQVAEDAVVTSACAFTALQITFTLSHAVPVQARDYGPVDSDSSPSFAAHAAEDGHFTNLTLLALEPLPAPATIAIPPVVVSSLAHWSYLDIIWMNIVDYVDFSDGPGEFSGPGFTATLRSGDNLVARFEAPLGHRFALSPHPDAESNLFTARGCWPGAADQISHMCVTAVTWENLVGPAPVIETNRGGVGNAGEAIVVEFLANVSADCAFTAVQFTFAPDHPFPVFERTRGGVTIGGFGMSASGDNTLADRTLLTIEPAGPSDAGPSSTGMVLATPSPNPCNPRATLSFLIPQAGPARLTVHDLKGRLVRVVHDGLVGAGWHDLAWDATDAAGRPAAAGVYFCRLVCGAEVATRRLTVVR